jgi:HNH endonuclease
MADEWLSLYDEFSTKIVSKTDKQKSAYVVNSSQKSILQATGIVPTDGPSDRILQIGVLGSATGMLSVSYYNSIREGAGRTPETRMGREIVGWIEIGDLLTIGRIGNEVFFSKEKPDASEPMPDELGRQLAKSVDPAKILERARRRVGPPPKRNRLVNDFVRDPYIVAAAISRSANICEMPACVSQLFNREDGRPYLEVHHIVPLGEGGDDTFVNAAALCPSCHRELHYGKFRLQKREVLRTEISQK